MIFLCWRHARRNYKAHGRQKDTLHYLCYGSRASRRAVEQMQCGRNLQAEADVCDDQATFEPPAGGNGRVRSSPWIDDISEGFSMNNENLFYACSAS